MITMNDLTTISKTLFVPMQGRIYSSIKYPNIFYDKEVLKLKNKLPELNSNQSEYTFMASAVRSMNIDRYIKEFFTSNPEGIIFELGCGLETTYYRCDTGKNKWYALDLPEVINYRKELLPPAQRQLLISESIFNYEWVDKYSEELNNNPILFIASGLFHYFEDQAIIELLNQLQKFNNAEIVFDTINKWGMKGIKKYMKELGHDEATMYFYVDNASELTRRIGNGAKLLKEEKYYNQTPKNNFQFMTKISMIISDLLFMVKMIHIKLS